MKTFLRCIFFATCLCVSVIAQTTNVTATITDSDGQLWKNATWISTLYNPTGTQRPVYTKTGLPVQTTYSGNVSSLGVLSQALPDNAGISPANTRWIFTIQSNTSATPSVLPGVTVTGTSQSLTTFINANITVPRFPDLSTAYGYITSEVTPTPKPGVLFYDTTCNVWSGSAWGSCAGGGGNPSLPNGSKQFDNNGVFGGNAYTRDVSAFSGADGGAKINACGIALTSTGGTCDATSLGASYSAAEDVTFYTNVKYLLPVGTLAIASGFHAILQTRTSVVGAIFGYNGGASTISCANIAANFGCVQSQTTGSTAGNINMENVSVIGTGTFTAGSVGIRLGGPGNIDVVSGTFTNNQTGNVDVGLYMGGKDGCTCYNQFLYNSFNGATVAVKTVNNSSYAGDTNSNTFIGGQMWGLTGIDMSGGGGNRIWGVDVEGASTHSAVINGIGNSNLFPYYESAGADLLNGLFNPWISGGNGLPDPVNSTCTNCLVVNANSAVTSTEYSPSYHTSLISSFDMVARGTPWAAYDLSQTNNGYGYNAHLNSSESFNTFHWTKDSYQFNGSEYFTGTNPALPNGAAARTLIAWVKLDPTRRGSLEAFVGYGTPTSNQEFTLMHSASTCYPVLVDWTSNANGPLIDMCDGNWHQIAATYDGTNVIVYGDGVAGTPIARAENTVGTTLYMGVNPVNGQDPFAGKLGYAAAYSTALTGAQITALYNNYLQTRNPLPLAGNKGVAVLVSGTATVTNTASCAPASTCVYKLARCAVNASTGIGALGLGTVSAGTSFVINSLGPTATVLTTDASSVCWQIN